MAIPSKGEYGVPEGLIFSYPVVTKDGKYKIVEGLNISSESQKRIDTTTQELISERNAVQDLLKWKMRFI